jgi:hypothetical protein
LLLPEETDEVAVPCAPMSGLTSRMRPIGTGALEPITDLQLTAGRSAAWQGARPDRSR